MKQYRRNDTIIASHNGRYYPMVIDDGIVYIRDGVKVINAKSSTMQQNYPEPISKIHTNCGQITFEELFTTMYDKYPEYAIQLELELKITKPRNRFEIDRW